MQGISSQPAFQLRQSLCCAASLANFMEIGIDDLYTPSHPPLAQGPHCTSHRPWSFYLITLITVGNFTVIILIIISSVSLLLSSLVPVEKPHLFCSLLCVTVLCQSLWSVVSDWAQCLFFHWVSTSAILLLVGTVRQQYFQMPCLHF